MLLAAGLAAATSAQDGQMLDQPPDAEGSAVALPLPPPPPPEASAGAAPDAAAAPLRAALAARYRALDDALEDLDPDGVIALTAPDFTATGTDGQARRRDEVRAQLARFRDGIAAAAARTDLRAETVLRTAEPREGGAAARARVRTRLELTNEDAATGEIVAVLMDSFVDHEWAQVDGTWLLRRERVVSQRRHQRRAPR